MAGFIHIRPETVFSYFDNVVCPLRANGLHSYCIAAILQQTNTLYKEHCQEITCYCIKCRIDRLLGQTLKQIKKSFLSKKKSKIEYQKKLMKK